MRVDEEKVTEYQKFGKDEKNKKIYRATLSE
jgi:hypothetical protein